MYIVYVVIDCPLFIDLISLYKPDNLFIYCVYKINISIIIIICTGVLISPQPKQEGNKLQRQKILMFIYPIYNHNWRNISTNYVYNKTSIK